MNKLVLLFVALLLVSVVGCSSGDSVTGPDTPDQIQTNDTAEKPAVSHRTEGDPPGGNGGEGDPDEDE